MAVRGSLAILRALRKDVVMAEKGSGLLGWLRGEAKSAPVEAEGAPGQDATVAPAVPEEQASDRYRDLGEIGRGAFASVRRVYDRNLLRSVAMKLIDPRVADIKGELDRFVEEAQITGQLEHPNIPAVHELGIDETGTYFFTMNYVRGQTLEQVFRNNFSVRSERHLFQALQVFVKACDAVDYAHHHGVIHCDLKPANIMVGKHGEVYVMDWGIARLRAVSRPSGADTQSRAVAVRRGEKERADEGRVVGSIGYMSPEQAQGLNGQLDERSDVFSLGAILYRALTGRPAYLAQTEDEILELAADGRWVPPQEVVPKDLRLPPRLCAICEKAMAPKPRDRYQTVEQLKDEIERYLSGSGRTPVRAVAPGEVIVKEGEEGSSAYAIEKGRCVAYKMVDGQKQILREMGPGEIFGEMAILTQTLRTATVEAIEPVSVRVLTADSLAQELGQTFFIGRLIKVLAERFQDADAQVTTLVSERTRRTAQLAVLSHVAMGTRQGELAAAPWAVLRERLKKRHGLTEESALDVALEIPGVAVDAAADLITYRQPALPESETVNERPRTG
ncbi:MAG: protein kinase [Myxococcales bacterium]